MISHAVSAVPVSECTFRSASPIFTEALTAAEVIPTSPFCPLPHCSAEGVGVQKMPHLLLDVPQLLPAKRHPDQQQKLHKHLKQRMRGKEGEEREEWYLGPFTLQINPFLSSFDSLNMLPFYSLILWRTIQHPFILTKNLGGHLFFCAFKRSHKLFLSEKGHVESRQ